MHLSNLAVGLMLSFWLPPAGAAVGPVTVIGTVLDSAGAPVVGQTVFVARRSNGRLTVSFTIKDGSTSGLWNPNASTDSKGQFKIQVSSAQMADKDLAGGDFTIGILDCPKCFTNPTRELIRAGKPVVVILPEEAKVNPVVDVGKVVVSSRR